MSTEEIKNLLPPITLSLGGVLPLLIGSSPFSVPENCRALFSSILVLVVWLGYWMAYMFGEWPFLTNWPIVGLICVGAALMLAVLEAGQRTVSTKPDETGKNVPRLAIENRKYFWVYVLALLSISVAAALYAAPEGRVLMELNFPNDENAPKPNWKVAGVTRIEKAATEGGSEPWIALHHEETKEGTKCLLTAEEFAKTKEFRVWTIETKEAKSGQAAKKDNEIPMPWRGTKETSYALLAPGKGQHSRIVLERVKE
jgi:hypothetical protein